VDDELEEEEEARPCADGATASAASEAVAATASLKLVPDILGPFGERSRERMPVPEADGTRRRCLDSDPADLDRYGAALSPAGIPTSGLTGHGCGTVPDSNRLPLRRAVLTWRRHRDGAANLADVLDEPGRRVGR
jgi:hypothetical protein